MVTAPDIMGRQRLLQTEARASPSKVAAIFLKGMMSPTSIAPKESQRMPVRAIVHPGAAKVVAVVGPMVEEADVITVVVVAEAVVVETGIAVAAVVATKNHSSVETQPAQGRRLYFLSSRHKVPSGPRSIFRSSGLSPK